MENIIKCTVILSRLCGLDGHWLSVNVHHLTFQFAGDVKNILVAAAKNLH